MGKIIIAMPKQENAVRIKEIIKAKGSWDDIVICRKGSEILELAGSQEVSLVICMRKLTDMGYEELTSLLPGQVAVLLLTKDESLLPFSSAITKLMMPFRGEALIEAMKSILDSQPKPKKKKFRSAEEQQAIDQAKKILMESRDMTEPEAYRYLQKISMDTQRSFLETAKMILLWEEKTTEN